jgi:hypothetical protein
MNQKECQFSSLKSIAEGNAKMPPQPLERRFLWFMKRHLTPSQMQSYYRCTNTVRDFFLRLAGKNVPSDKPARPLSDLQTEPLKAGDLVRVRSMEEIAGTLNSYGKLKGCSFIDGMDHYCQTVQRVLKPMERFVDERDFKVKKCSGLVLLEGVMCEGVTAFGRCDRCCYTFWREEWLEKIE